MSAVLHFRRASAISALLNGFSCANPGAQSAKVSEIATKYLLIFLLNLLRHHARFFHILSFSQPSVLLTRVLLPTKLSVWPATQPSSGARLKCTIALAIFACLLPECS